MPGAPRKWEKKYMRIAKFVAPMVLALIVCASTQAADKPAKDGTKFNGTLGAKPADAKEGVVATLVVKGRGAAAESKTYTLTAEGDVAKQLTDLAGKSAKVGVTGTATGDVIKVTAVAERKAKEPA